jgi:hypothetical protein
MKQKFFEMMSWKGSGGDRWIYPPYKPSASSGASSSSSVDDPYANEGIELNDILLQVNELKPYCSQQVS